MKLDLLQVGMKYKYQQLCDAFGFKPATGNTKKKHMTTFEQYLKLEKQGTWFLVVEKYGEVQERNDKRKDNGKSEASIEADEQRAIFKPDEIQLAILWTLGSKYYENKVKEDSSIIYIPKNKLHVELGLCNQFFITLFRNKYYYTKLRKDDDREIVYDAWKVNVAFNVNTKYHNLNDSMKDYTLTAFKQLQRRKVLEYSYWKAWSDGSKEMLFTDEQMKVFLSVREDTLTWWNETYSNKQCTTIGNVYGNLTPKEIKVFEEKLKELLRETKEFRRLQYYCSCYKTYFSIRAIKKELSRRGIEVGDTKADFDKAFIENMQDTIKRVNNRIINEQVKRIDKLRNEQFKKFEKYEDELNKFYEYVEQHKERGFGRQTMVEPKKPNCDLIDYENYKEVLEILYLGLQLEMTLEQSGTMQGIEHCIESNKNRE